LASVDFRVDGKPNPPPVPLNAQVWGMVSVALADDIPDKSALLFTDPTGTLGEGILNAWVEPNMATTQSV